MKKSIKALATLLSCAFVFSACNDTSSSSSSTGEPVLGDVTAKVFSLTSTHKIMREQDTSAYYANGKTLSVSLAKNEYESVQLFINPDKAVQKFNLETADLTSAAGDKIKKEQISVYAQWYVQTNINSSMTSNRPLGYYPDALVPLDAYREYGYDKIAAGDNQGLTVTVKTATDTPAGTYTGNFKLTYNNETEEIPVQVTVWDFAVPEDNNVLSAIGNPFYEELISGALDNTPEMYQKYNEFLLDYRINNNNLIYRGLSEEQQIMQLRKYCNDKRVTAYSYVQEGYNLAAVEKKMRILIENSDSEHNLLKKNFIYAFDEPYRREEKASEFGKQIVDLLIALANEYEKAGTLDDYGLTKEDIISQDILAAFTCQSLNTEIEGLRTYCPSISGYKSQADRARYERLRKEAYTGANNELADNNYADTWWYTATGPSEPLPNQHMDNDLYPLRAASWMQYEYDVKGYLNWGAYVYADTTTISGSAGTDYFDNADIYNNPADAVKATNGDGYIVYPGIKFGIDAPIPSLRMMTLTDGFEDYEYLYLFNKLVEEYASQYGEFSANKLLTPLYRSIYTDVEAYKKPNAVLEAREVLANYIQMLSAPMHAVVSVGDVNLANKTVAVDIYAQTGTTFTVGETVYQGTPCGNGVKISVPCSIESSAYLNGTLKNGNESFALTLFLSDKIKSVNTFTTQAELAKVTPTQRYGEPKDHITLALDETLGETALKATFGACTNAGSYEVANYNPALTISKADFLGNDSINDVKLISIRVYNPAQENTNVIFQLCAGTRKKQIANITLAPGWNTVTIPNVNELEWTYKDQITDLKIAIAINTNADVTLYFSNLYYTYVH